MQYIPLIPHVRNKLTICVKYPEPHAKWRYILSIYADNNSWTITITAVLFIAFEVYFHLGFELQPRKFIECLLYVIGVITSVSQPIQKY